jgi:hypothetical protein
MGVNHRRANVLVAQEFLHGADVVAISQQVCRERIAKQQLERLRDGNPSADAVGGILPKTFLRIGAAAANKWLDGHSAHQKLPTEWEERAWLTGCRTATHQRLVA